MACIIPGQLHPGRCRTENHPSQAGDESAAWQKPLIAIRVGLLSIVLSPSTAAHDRDGVQMCTNRISVLIGESDGAMTSVKSAVSITSRE